MVKTLLKSTLREIRQSLGRYMAIFAIVGLGVSFFAGLRMCQPSMLATGVSYLEEYQFYDFRLMSTLGFTQQDVDAFAQLDGIEFAQGSVYTEFLWQKTEDEQAVLISHMLTQQVNQPKLVAGRMPEQANECLGDARYFTEQDLGRQITVSPKNDEDTLELLACGSYTLVGLAHSPLYLNFERGTASMGGGSIAAFVLIPEDGYDPEAYSEIYLRMQNSAAAYSDAYEDQADRLEPAIEAALQKRADLRFETLYNDALEEIHEGEQELADGWQEYYTEKADADLELADAYQELLDGEEEYESGLADYEQGEQDYADGMEQFEDGIAELRDAREQLNDAWDSLKEGKEKLEQGESDYQQLCELYGAGAQLAAGVGFGSSSDLVAALNSGLYPELEQAVDTALRAQGSSLQAFLSGWNAAEQSLSGPLDEAAIAEQRAALDQGWREYYAGLDEYEEGQQEYREGVKELQKAQEELEDARQKLDEAAADLAEGRQELDDGWQEYRDGLAEAEEEFADARQELADGQQELDDAYRELEDLERANTYVLTRDENIGYVCFENDTSIVAAISVVFPVFFFLVAALVCMTTMKRMVDEQRTQIGVLKAMGYSRGQIIGKYLFYSGSAAVAGGVLGYALGSWGLPLVIWEIYKMMYGFAPLKSVFDPALAAISFAAALLCSMGATYLSCRIELQKPAAQLIRPKAPKAGKRVFLEYITPVWRRMSFLRKVSVRNVLRYQSRLIMMILGIGGCTALLITGFGIRDSITSIADDQYDRIFVYDYAVTFQDPQNGEQAGRFLTDHGWKDDDGLLVYSGSADVLAQDSAKSAYLVVPESGSLDGFVSLYSGDQSLAFPGDGEVVLNVGLAQTLQVNTGDTVSLRSDDFGTIQATVSGICDNYIFNYAFVSPETCRQQAGRTPDYNTLYVHGSPGADPYEESVPLAEGEGVANVTVNAATRERINNTLSRLNIIVIVVVVFAAALAFVVLYNLTNINITERVREIATIKVLGFYQNEVAAYVFREIKMLAAVGGLVGMLMGKALHAFVMAQVKIDSMFFPCRVAPASYIISFALTMLFTVLITRGMRPRLNKIDMAESLKSIE